MRDCIYIYKMLIVNNYYRRQKTLKFKWIKVIRTGVRIDKLSNNDLYPLSNVFIKLAYNGNKPSKNLKSHYKPQ